MNILQLIQRPQRRGAEIFAVQLSGELIKMGHQVLLVSVFPGPGGLAFTGDWIRLDRSPNHRFFDLAGWRAFSKIVAEFRADIVQANAADTLKFAVFSKKVFGWNTPIVYRNANQMGDFIRGGIHRMFNQFLLNGVRGVASVSSASKRDLHYSFVFPKEQSTVIPIGIDSDEIDVSLEARPPVDLPKRFLLQIGGLVPEKDPLGMLAIFREIAKTDAGTSLVFLGSGQLQEALLSRIGELGLSDRVKVIPNQTNIFPILKHAEALVMPSKIEGLPAVILESMYCRVPVVAYGVGGIPEVLVTHQSGWCIPPTDQKGFITAIEELLSMNTQRKETILSNAYELVSFNFTLEKVGRLFENFYSRLLNSSQKTEEF
jgi:glycosyltransferase involved in cell wall biosynthesis